MAPPTHITDHVARTLALLPSQHADATRLRALLTAIAEAIQEVEDDAWACIVDRQLDTAAGAQLDQYGRVVGARRDGLLDDDYRALIRIRILANRSNGQADVILRVVAGLLADLLIAPPGVEYRVLPPAAYGLQCELNDTPTAARLALISRIVDEITPSGVSREVVYGESPMFRLDSDDLTSLDVGQLGATLP